MDSWNEMTNENRVLRTLTPLNKINLDGPSLLGLHQALKPFEAEMSPGQRHLLRQIEVYFEATAERLKPTYSESEILAELGVRGEG